MRRKIRRVALLGSGVMGAAIAAHLANVGIPSIMLDIVPSKLTPEEEKRGLSLKDQAVRNRFAASAKENLLRSQPAPLAIPEFLHLIETGNMEDDLGRLSEVDWIIEAVVENLKIKQDLLQKISQVRRPGTIVSTNTSGIPIAAVVSGLPLELRQHFLGTHFFNPPRYMRLLEIIALPETLPEVRRFMSEFGERVLGKGIVYAKDTPNFIANRIGVAGMLISIRTMLEKGYTIPEVDAITGLPMGRPKMASFRTLDLVGLDTFAHVARNLYENAPQDESREVFRLPEFIEKMLAQNWLGNKTGQGFYKTVEKEGRKEIFALDYRTMEYGPTAKIQFPSLEAAKSAGDGGKRIKTLIEAQDRAGEYAWEILSQTLLYAARRIPEISDDIVNIDRALKWGFNWEMGAFEIWDAIGVEETLARMRREGKDIPPWVEKVLRTPQRRFYIRENGGVAFYDLKTETHQPIPENPRVILLSSLKERKKLVEANLGASLIDLGDGVACLEFHSYMNAIGLETIEMIHKALKIVEENFLGLVIGNHAPNFSVGANLLLIVGEILKSNWAGIEKAVKAFQDASLAMKYFEKPIVAAPHGMTLGGGCEICLSSHRIRAALETYMGQVEMGVGLIPGGGGNKEIYLRCIEGIPEGVNVDLIPFLRKAFENIALAKVSTSAEEARKMGLLRATDGVTANLDHLIFDAKQTVLAMVQEGFRPPRRRLIPVAGDGGRAAIKYLVHTLRQGNHITEYEEYLAGKLAYVMTGGNVLSGALVTEEHLLDLEREAFVSLCGEKKTQERISHMLKTNKPLRN